MSVDMRKAHAVAKEYDDKLKASDFSPSSLVIVRGVNDMTTLVYSDAFAKQWQAWYLVFTEHYGFHVFHKEDYYVAQYSERTNISRLNAK